MTKSAAVKETENEMYRLKCLSHPTIDPKFIPKDKLKGSKSNALTESIKRYINRLPLGYAKRTSTEGRVIIKNGKSIRIPSSGAIGAADISAIYNGAAIEIEVKVGKDKQSPGQVRYMQEIQKAKGIYFIARTLDGFLEDWNIIMNRINST